MRSSKRFTWPVYSLGLLCVLMIAGCPTPSTPEQIDRFNQGGPLQPHVDRQGLVRSKLPAGVYRPVAGDVLELVMPAILQDLRLRRTGVDDSYLVRPESHLCRVTDDGRITLPIVGELDIRGRSLPQIESLATDAYYPRYVRERPSIVARVLQYRTARVSVVGAITSPGVYELQSNELSLVALLMKAGGIDLRGSEAQPGGASVVRIHRAGGVLQTQPAGLTAAEAASAQTTHPAGFADEPGLQVPELVGEPATRPAGEPAGPEGESYAVVLPIRGLNMPFVDVPLMEGDMVEVEGLRPEVFTVIGLVNKAGAFPYPPGTQYNLLQGLSFAAGLNDIADPQYVKVYRQDADGSILEGVFSIKGQDLASAARIRIKPGDVIAVEHTLATRFNLILAEVLRVNAGVNLNASYTIWNPYNYNNNRGSFARDVLGSATPTIISTVLGQ